jgi:hypothetical protein
MPLDAAHMLADVRSLLNESSAALWSDAELQQWLAHGAIDISAKTGCVEAFANVTLAGSTIVYAAPTSFNTPSPSGNVRLIRIYAALLSNVALVRIHPRMFGQVNANVTGNTPTYYAHFGNEVYFYPVGSGASGTVILLCTLVTDDYATDLRDPWQRLAITYAAYRAKLKDQRYAEAAQLFNEYSQSLAMMRRDLIEADRMPSARAELTLPDLVQTPVA